MAQNTAAKKKYMKKALLITKRKGFGLNYFLEPVEKKEEQNGNKKND